MCVYTHNPTTSKSKTLYEICVLLGKYTTYRGNSLPTPKEGTESLSLKFGRNYHNRPRDYPEELRTPLLRGGSLKSWERCVSAQYALRTHLATLVANTAHFLQDPVGLVHLFVSDFSILAIEAFGGFKIFIVFILFCSKQLRFTLHWLFGFNLFQSRNCHLHGIASFGFCSTRWYAAQFGDYLTNKQKLLLLVLTS